VAQRRDHAFTQSVLPALTRRRRHVGDVHVCSASSVRNACE
jgi:hypothetical protein